MRYIVFECIGIETVYIVPANDEKELQAVKEMLIDEGEARKIGEFISDHPLPHDWKYFACVSHSKNIDNPAYFLLKRAKRNIDMML